MISNNIRVSLFVFIGWVLFSQSAFAAYRMMDSIEEFGEKRYIHPTPARLKAGPVIFHPTLRNKVQYDDNILLEDNDPRDDILFEVMPGAVIEIPIDTHQLVVGYEADIEVFAKRDRENDQNQNMFALVDINFPSWYINVLERFKETSGRSGTTFTDRIPRYDQSINPKIGYKWNRITVEGGFRHILRDFRRQVNDPLDYQLTEWTGVVFYDIFARLKALTDYTVAQIDYDDDFTRNGTFQQARIGLEGEIFPHTVLKVRAGPHFRKYEVQSKPDFNSWVASALIEHTFRDKLKLDLEFKREPVEATIVGINYYKEHRLRLGAEYKILPRWTVFSDAGWYHHRYDEHTVQGNRADFRKDHHAHSTSGLRYQFRDWWEFELAYEFLRRDSNFGSFDYTDNRVSLSSAIIY